MTAQLSRQAQAVLEALRGCERGTAVRRLAWIAGLPDTAARKAVHELDSAGLVWLSSGGSGGKIVHLAARVDRGDGERRDAA